MIKRLKKVHRGEPFFIQVDDEFLIAFSGETLATVILGGGRKAISKSSRTKSPRGYYCGMGICNECIVTLENGDRVRACQTLVTPTMRIRTR